MDSFIKLEESYFGMISVQNVDRREVGLTYYLCVSQACIFIFKSLSLIGLLR